MAKSFVQNVAKNIQPRTTPDFRPITSTRLLHTIFAYTILGWIADMLEWNQREGQHGFQSTKRVEEHLPTLNIILDRTFFFFKLFNAPAIVDFQPWFLSPLCRKNVGFDEFYGGAQLEDIGPVDHIFIGSRSLNPTAGTRAWGGGLRPLWIETFGINIVNFSSNFAVHKTPGLYFVQDTWIENRIWREYWKTWSAVAVMALRRRNFLPLERFGWLENSCYAMNTQRWYEYTADFC